MNREITDETPIAMLTVGQLRDVLKLQSVALQQPTATPTRNLAYGYNGLAKLLGVSRTWAAEIKLSGQLDEALMQMGRVIVFDADKVLEIMSRKTGGRKK